MEICESSVQCWCRYIWPEVVLNHAANFVSSRFLLLRFKTTSRYQQKCEHSTAKQKLVRLSVGNTGIVCGKNDCQDWSRHCLQTIFGSYMEMLSLLKTIQVRLNILCDTQRTQIDTRCAYSISLVALVVFLAIKVGRHLLPTKAINLSDIFEHSPVPA